MAELDASEAAALLFAAHQAGLLRLGVLLLGDRGAAEDVIQDAFIGLLNHWPRLRDPGKALAYLRASVVNRSRNQLRRKVIARRIGIGMPPPELSAESAVLLTEERKAVLVALRRLPPRRQIVLVLRFYFDLTDDEIAEALTIRPATVRSTATRALRALGALLGEEAAA
jgi:RNA polymerase sigma-70 factor (sigma-E family)